MPPKSLVQLILVFFSIRAHSIVTLPELNPGERYKLPVSVNYGTVVIPANEPLVYRRTDDWGARGLKNVFYYTDKSTSKSFEVLLPTKDVGGNPAPIQKFSDAKTGFREFSGTAKPGCDSADLRSLLPPPRDSGPLKWCFSYATADYLSVRHKKPVSASDLAIREYSLKNPNAEIASTIGGDNRSTLLRVVNGGFCSEDSFASMDKTKPIFKAFQEFEKFFEKYKSAAQDLGTDCLESLRANPLMKGLQISGLEDLRKILSHKSALKGLDYVRRRSCKAMEAESIDAQVYEHSKTPKLNAVKYLMDHKKPALISVSVNGIYPDDYKPVGKKMPTHGLVVVAREFNKDTKTCEYYLRNSWGAECPNYNSKLRCDTQYGGFWISEAHLESVILNTNYIEP